MGKNSKNQNISFRVIKEKEIDLVFKNGLSELCCSYYFVNENDPVEDLARDLESDLEIFAVAVVDNDMKVTGLLVRREMFDILGKKFGRDLYHFKKVKKLIEDHKIFRVFKSFNAKKNIFKAAEQIDDDLSNTNNHYYLLSYNNGFYGIVSSKDILVYLSRITQDDLKIAEEIQQNIVKSESFYDSPCLRILGYTRMARVVGGDYYNYFKYSDTNWFICVCDVCGKGTSAAMVTGIINSVIITYDFRNGLKDFVIHLNSHIYNTFKLKKFLTAIFIDYNEITGEMEVFDLGHSMNSANFYIYKDSSLKVIMQENLNTAIGFKQDLVPKSNKIQLSDNDTIFLCSDGLCDQRNVDGEFYGIDNIERIFKSSQNKSIKEIKNQINEDYDFFRADMPRFDDVTFMIMEIRLFKNLKDQNN